MPTPLWKPGQSGNPKGKPKGAKNRETIAKEERRAIFDIEVSKIFVNKILEARPEYLLDQFLGKAEDKLNIEATIKKITNPEDRKKLEEILRDAIKRFND